MKLPRFGVEEWLNVHEKNATYDIAGVSIAALSLEELFQLTQQETRSKCFFSRIRAEENGLWLDRRLASI